MISIIIWIVVGFLLYDAKTLKLSFENSFLALTNRQWALVCFSWPLIPVIALIFLALFIIWHKIIKRLEP